MIDALNKAGFDRENAKHLLISCGDNFDRGNQSGKVRTYLFNLPNKILIMGNHEELLKELVINGENFYDIENGTLQTLIDFAGYKDNEIDIDKIKNFEMIRKKAENKVLSFCEQCLDYYETKKYIFVHGWIPEIDDWKNGDEEDWYNARWTNGLFNAINSKNNTGKILVFGHCGVNSYNKIYRYRKDDFSIFQENNCIALDATTYISHQVNVLVVKDELIK